MRILLNDHGLTIYDNNGDRVKFINDTVVAKMGFKLTTYPKGGCLSYDNVAEVCALQEAGSTATTTSYPNKELEKVLTDFTNGKLDAKIAAWQQAVDNELHASVVEVFNKLPVSVKRRQSYDPVGDQLDRITKALKFLKDHNVDIGPDGDAQVTSSLAVKTKFPKK